MVSPTIPAVPWDTRETLPDDFDAWIGSALFGFRSNYTDQSGAQVPLLIWTDLYCPDLEPGDQNEIVWSLGTGWQVSPDGKMAIPVSKRNQAGGFTTTSMMGRLISRVAKEMKVPGITLPPNYADAWSGLGFHLNRQEIHFEGGSERNISDRKRLLPTSYLGRKDPAEIRVSAARGNTGQPGGQQNGFVPGSPVATVPMVAPTPTSVITSTSSDLANQVAAIAKAHKAAGKTKADWQGIVLGLPGVALDAALLSKVLDDSPAGIWAQA